MRRVSKTKRALIINLIEQDLIYYRFMCSLGAIQLIADSFVLEIDEIIFSQTGIEQHKDIDKIYDQYMQHSKKAMDVPNENLRSGIHELAVEICDYLESCTK